MINVNKTKIMKNLFSIICLFWIIQVNSQCAKIYVKEHLSGSPICQLIEGDFIEICEDMNEVNGCPYNFYIYDKGFSSGSLTYQLSLDRGWSTHSMTLMVNPKTKRFGFILQGQTAMYSYYTEVEMVEMERIENERRAREAAEAEKRKQNLLNEDQKIYPSINALITDGNLEVAKAEIRKLHFPGKFPYLNELYRKEDAILKPQIKNLLAEKKLNEAIENYDALNLQETKNALFSEMQLALSGYYKTFEQPFKDDQLSKIINDNKGVFTKLAPGNYKITSDSEGNLAVDGRTLGINSTPLTKTLGNNNQFSVNTSASGTVKIEQTTSNNGVEQILVSTTKPIFKTRKGKLYKKAFLGKGMLDPNVTVTFHGDVPKNRYRKVQPQTIHTMANGIKIATINENKLLFEGKFHNRALVVSSRALLLAGGLFVSGLRIYEYTLIP
jgi:hypothetical protein